MSDDASLRGDCSRCIGLCCVALAFDRGPQFGFDKAAGTPCPHLDDDARCAIHHRLEADGMSGCAGYDCRGAGQIVTAMFDARSWRDNPATARLMFLAFTKLREVQLMRVLVGDAGCLADKLVPKEGWSLRLALAIDLAALRREVRALLVMKVSGKPARSASGLGGY
jgi:hypothetical protein